MLKPTIPEVEIATIWPDKVRRGTMLLQARGVGTFVARRKVTLKVPETQAKDVRVGQEVDIFLPFIETTDLNLLMELNRGFLGRVTHIDPASVTARVGVDVELEREPSMPPLSSVEGYITIGKLADAVFASRPQNGQSGTKVMLFKIDEDRKGAQRVRVTLGRSSENTIEVVDGLRVGDEVILSDMSMWSSDPRIRLK
jgi:HlyD family secretion protein